MKIIIDENTQDNTYAVKVFDGPDGIDQAEFVCGSLGEAFEEIMRFRIFNGLSYAEEEPGTTLENYFNLTDHD